MMASQPSYAERREYLRTDIQRPSCSNLRLDSNVFEIQRKQTDSPWCYAYVSADLLSWELKERVSAADIALAYNDLGHKRLQNGKLHSDIREGGYPALAMELAMKRGLCLENDMPSQDYLFSGGKDGVDVQMFEMIAGIENIKKVWDQDQDIEYLCKNMQGIQEIFPLLTLQNIGEIILKSAPFSVVNTLQERNCDGKRKRPMKNLESISIYGEAKSKADERERLLAKLDQLLNKQKPIGLAVKSEFIGIQNQALHAVSVVGRRLNAKNECEYLIRDSNPSGCAGNSTYKCDKNGDTWANESLLRKNLEWLYYLGDQK